MDTARERRKSEIIFESNFTFSVHESSSGFTSARTKNAHPRFGSVRFGSVRFGAPGPHWRARPGRCPTPPRPAVDSPPLRAIDSVTKNWDRASFESLRHRRGNRVEDDGGERDGGEGRWDGRDAPSDESGSDGSS